MEEKKEGMEKVDEVVNEAAAEANAETAEAAAETVEAAAETAEAAAETAEETAEAATETVEETAEAVAETVEETAGAAAETVEETAGAAAETAEETAEAATETVDTVENVVAEAPKKSKKGLFIGLGAAAVVAVGAFAAVTLSAKDPKTVVIDAFKNVYSAEREAPIEEIFGFKDMYSYSYANPVEGGMEMKLDWMDTDESTLQMLQGAGFRLEEQMNIPARQMNMEIAAIYGGMDLISGQIYLDDEKMVMASPELMTSRLLWNYREEIPADSFLGKALEESDMDIDMNSYMNDYMDYVWGLYNTENKKFDVQALWDRYKTGSKAIDDFKAAMTVAKSDKATFTVDGKEVSCKGYDVTITKEALVQFLDTTSEFFLKDETIKSDVVEYMSLIAGAFGNNKEILKSAYGGETPEEIQANLWEVAEDGTDEMIKAIQDHLGDTITMKVYVDSKGNLAAFDANTAVTSDENTVDMALHAELKGGSYPTQNVDAKLVLTKQEGDTLEVVLLKNGAYDGNQLSCDVNVDLLVDGETFSGGYTGTYAVSDGAYHMEFLVSDGTTGGSVSIMGNITDLEKGKGFTMNMDEIAVKSENEAMMTASGVYYLRPYDGEITVPEGTEFNMITATEDDWTNLGNEVSMNLFAMLMRLMSGGADVQ